MIKDLFSDAHAEAKTNIFELTLVDGTMYEDVIYDGTAEELSDALCCQDAIFFTVTDERTKKESFTLAVPTTSIVNILLEKDARLDERNEKKKSNVIPFAPYTIDFGEKKDSSENTKDKKKNEMKLSDADTDDLFGDFNADDVFHGFSDVKLADEMKHEYWDFDDNDESKLNIHAVVKEIYNNLEQRKIYLTLDDKASYDRYVYGYASAIAQALEPMFKIVDDFGYCVTPAEKDSLILLGIESICDIVEFAINQDTPLPLAEDAYIETIEDLRNEVAYTILSQFELKD